MKGAASHRRIDTEDPAMAHQQNWTDAAPGRGWLSRMLAPEAHTKPATTAFAIAVVGAAAFVASMATTWKTVAFDITATDGRTQDSQELIYSGGVTTTQMLGLVYVLGMIALLAVAGAAINRTDLALRIRFAAVGLTVGLLAVVVALTVAPPDLVNQSVGAFPEQVRDRMTTSFQPGLLLAYAAVVLPIVAIWSAGRPAARLAIARAAAPEVDAVPVGGGQPEATFAPVDTRWAVHPDEPLDLTVTPER
jgi:hypothetical protein